MVLLGAARRGANGSGLSLTPRPGLARHRGEGGAGGDPRAPEAAARAARAPDLPPLVGVLRPLIDVVASIPVSVHAKLLAGFLASALLLLAMGLLDDLMRPLIRIAASVIARIVDL